ncbi:MAG: ArnT family glycosyltransferase [Tepidisphaeraceae bacterium]
MQSAELAMPQSDSAGRALPARARALTTALVWLASLGLLLLALGNRPVQRTQEARVLETAREMLGGGARAWLIPHANGVVRLQKPPLAYWMSAAAFEIFGVHEWAGRVPMALCGWLTLGMAYAFAARLFGPRAGLLAGGILLGSYLFARHTRLAETDIVVTLAVTLAIGAIWRGFDADGDLTSTRVFAFDAATFGWFQLSGAAMGLAIVAKGAPVAFAIIFLVALTLVERRWRTLLRWIASGAPITILLVGAPWWAYVLALPEAEILRDEASDLFEGRDHFHWFTAYFPMLLKASLPWCGFGVAAIVSAVGAARASPNVRRLLLWCASIFIPLCIPGNKQDHYLLPLMPPLAMLTAWWIDQSLLTSAGRGRNIAFGIFVVTVSLLTLGMLALPIVARHVRGEVITLDVTLMSAGLLGAGLTWLLLAQRRRSGAFAAFTVVTAVMMSLLVSMWSPSMEKDDSRVLATRIAAAAPAPYYFYGEKFSLPLVFAMRTVIPRIKAADEIPALLATKAEMTVIVLTTPRVPDQPAPQGFSRVAEIRSAQDRYAIYRASR